MPQGQAGCELYLVIETGDGAAARLTAALDAAGIATVLIRAAEGRALDAAAAKPLVELARKSGIAALVAGEPALVRATGAEGPHLGAGAGNLPAYRAARAARGAQKMGGVDRGVSRHDAMTIAEAGADYVAFGAPAHLKDKDKGLHRRDELVAWWAEIFQVPCVAFDVETAEEAEALARSGAGFVAVTLHAGFAAGDVRSRIADIAAALQSVASEQECA